MEVEVKEGAWYVYIVKCADGSLYTGIAKSVEDRIRQHNSGTGAKYTKGRGPVMELYREMAENRSLASKREYEIKQMTKKEKLSFIGLEPK